VDELDPSETLGAHQVPHELPQVTPERATAIPRQPGLPGGGPGGPVDSGRNGGRLVRMSNDEPMTRESAGAKPLNENDVDRKDRGESGRVPVGEDDAFSGAEDHDTAAFPPKSVRVLAADVERVVGMLENADPQTPTTEPTHGFLEGERFARAARHHHLEDRGHPAPWSAPGRSRRRGRSFARFAWAHWLVARVTGEQSGTAPFPAPGQRR